MKELSNLNLQHLYYFHVVAAEGSIKQAAKVLHLTQPAISMRIRSLEENLKTSLFDRKQRQLRLTSAGQGLYESTNHIFSLTRKALLALSPVSRPKRLLRAGFVPSVSKAFVHDVLKPLWSDKVILEVSHGLHSDLLFQLESNHLDLMLTDVEPKKKKYLNVREVAQRQLIFAAAPKFKSLKTNFPKSLNHIPMIGFTHENALGFQLERFLAMNKVTPNMIGRIDDFSLLTSFLIDGEAVGVLSKRAAQKLIDAQLLVSLGEMKDVVSRLWIIERLGNK